MSDQQLERWEHRTGTPMIVGAVLFLIAYAWPILQPDLSRGAAKACSVTSITVWILFAADLSVRLFLAERRWPYVRKNWLDVVTLVVPMLRPLRALRVLVAINVLSRRGREFARGKVVGYVVAAVAIVGVIAALAVLDAERKNPEANIKSFGDALWWAATTVTTVGYGDRFPTTTEGRIVSGGLMMSGIALLGVVTASLASWFVEKVGEVQAAGARTDEEVTDLAAEVRALREEVTAQRQAAATKPAVGNP